MGSITMSHLHIPDGILPLWLWAGGLALALVTLVISVIATRGASRQSIAFRGALGGLVLVAMAVELPLGPIEYHLSLVGPVGALVGPAASFQLVFVVSAILAFAGHGGFTVVGLNALVLGSGAALAGPLFRVLVRRLRPAVALAATTAISQGLSGLLWMLVVGVALRGDGTMPAPAHLAALSAFALPVWAGGLLVESAVAYGLGGFLARVRPDLLGLVPPVVPVPR
jgi:cobalt/nickel transport system permease protein